MTNDKNGAPEPQEDNEAALQNARAETAYWRARAEMYAGLLNTQIEQAAQGAARHAAGQAEGE